MRPAIAISLLESVKKQFSGDDLAKADAILKELRSEQSDLERSREVLKAVGEIGRMKAQLAYYRKRLSVYEAKGDEVKAAKLREAIQAVEQGIGTIVIADLNIIRQ